MGKGYCEEGRPLKNSTVNCVDSTGFSFNLFLFYFIWKVARGEQTHWPLPLSKCCPVRYRIACLPQGGTESCSHTHTCTRREREKERGAEREMRVILSICCLIPQMTVICRDESSWSLEPRAHSRSATCVWEVSPPETIHLSKDGLGSMKEVGSMHSLTLGLDAMTNW